MDTDNDGLCDGPWANAQAPNCDHNIYLGGEDLDADGVLDADETNNNAADTDGDGMPDGWEVVF